MLALLLFKILYSLLAPFQSILIMLYKKVSSARSKPFGWSFVNEYFDRPDTTMKIDIGNLVTPRLFRYLSKIQGNSSFNTVN